MKRPVSRDPWILSLPSPERASHLRRALGRAGIALALVAGSLACNAAGSDEAGATPRATAPAAANAAAAESAAEARLVEVYVTDWCPYCQRLEAFLQENEVDYVRKNVEEDAQAAREHASLGVGGGIPVTRIDGSEVVRGFRPDVIANLLGIEAD